MVMYTVEQMSVGLKDDDGLNDGAAVCRSDGLNDGIPDGEGVIGDTVGICVVLALGADVSLPEFSLVTGIVVATITSVPPDTSRPNPMQKSIAKTLLLLRWPILLEIWAMRPSPVATTRR